jgi:hypothetical protein
VPKCTLHAEQFSLSPTDGRPAAASDEEDIDLPFAVQLGEAVRHGSGFAATALRATQQGNQAVLALLPRGLKSASVVELGAVHGDVSAPRLASNGSALIAVVPEADASGQSLRLAALQPEAPTNPVRWGASVHDGEDESQAVEVALSGSSAALVWDDWNKHANHGVVKLALTSLQDVGTLSAALDISRADTDAESPRIVATSDGFWIAWAVNDEAPGESTTANKKALQAPSPGADPAAGANGGTAGEPDEPRVAERTLVAVQRGIELLRLDAQGVARGAPKRVTPPGLRVTQFDLASDSRGVAYVAWRAGASSLASEGGEVGLLTISDAGEENRLPLAEIESGAGVPQLLFDTSATSGVLAVAQPGEETALLRITSGAPALASALDAAFGAASPVALAGQDLLLARSVGRALLFTLATCP